MRGLVFSSAADGAAWYLRIMTNTDQISGQKSERSCELRTLTIKANDITLDISEINYGEEIKQGRSLCKASAVGALIPDGSDVVINYELEDGYTRRDTLRNVRRAGKDQYTCLSIEWGDYQHSGT